MLITTNMAGISRTVGYHTVVDPTHHTQLETIDYHDGSGLRAPAEFPSTSHSRGRRRRQSLTPSSLIPPSATHNTCLSTYWYGCRTQESYRAIRNPSSHILCQALNSGEHQHQHHLDLCGQPSCHWETHITNAYTRTTLSRQGEHPGHTEVIGNENADRCS